MSSGKPPTLWWVLIFEADFSLSEVADSMTSG